MPKTTRYELWKQSIEQLQQAIDALDQAHATMKSIGLEDVDNGCGGAYRATIKSVCGNAESILEELRTADCDECQHAIQLHVEKYGCEYERGDVATPCRDGGTIMAAAGPCGCDWWHREVA
ncbi:MAG TPA: hypothetical protein VKX49_12430 [Bryobacteraceae bacterium]|nr:hypothetical protein [Bryobacteraceae bacterium]